MFERGYDLVYLHCSSDNNSLDGIFIPKLKVAMVDGTALHIVDPKTPGAVDEIIHLGDYWNEEGIVANKEKILAENAEIGRLFQSAYRFLQGASVINNDSEEIGGRALEKGYINIRAQETINDYFGKFKLAPNIGNIRKMFASAITPDGLVNHLETIITTQTVIILKGMRGSGTDLLLEKIKSIAIERGFDVEAYYCALLPEKIEHLVIPEIGLSFTTTNEYHRINVENALQIDMNSYLNKQIIELHEDTLEYNNDIYEKLIFRAVQIIKRAKRLHDLMETRYIPNMLFEKVERCLNETLQRIIDYSKE